MPCLLEVMLQKHVNSMSLNCLVIGLCVKMGIEQSVIIASAIKKVEENVKNENHNGRGLQCLGFVNQR